MVLSLGTKDEKCWLPGLLILPAAMTCRGLPVPPPTSSGLSGCPSLTMLGSSPPAFVPALAFAWDTPPVTFQGLPLTSSGLCSDVICLERMFIAVQPKWALPCLPSSGIVV